MGPQPSIAHYRITSKLGEGGMGEVWRATDTKLGREVAIKVVPESFAQDGDRLARFTREAQVLASLNHPNIAAIYGVEDRALILELVEGPTLAERIAEGPIPVEEAVPIARQIAEALEYAHEKAVIHRDLKPANVKITPEGRVKVLDFGLAKALTPDAPATNPAASPTLTMHATVAGVIMGTAGYMSPEQAKGKPVDRRADIWAFGAVLVEMLTGRALYSGETVGEILAAVIMKEPAIPESAPPHIRALLRRCLDRDPSRRLQAIGEARIALDSPEAPAAEPAHPPARGVMLPWTVAASLFVALLAASWVSWRANRPVDKPMMRFSVDLGPDSIRGSQWTAVISPDGNRLVFLVRGAGGVPQLATRVLDQPAATVLVGTEGADQPFFSPDGRSIGFFATQKLKTISVQGGAAIVVCDTIAQPRGGTWGEDGNIIACLDNQRLFRVPAAGGKPEPLGKPEDHSERSWRRPQMLPKGQLVLFTGGLGAVGSGFEQSNIDVLALKTGQVKTVHRGGYFARYLPSGHLVYVHQGTLFAVPFDAERLETRGTPVPVLNDLVGTSISGAAQLDFSGTGTFVYLSGKADSTGLKLSWLDSSGKTELVWATPSALLGPKLSPDGKLVAGSLADDIVVYDPVRAAATKLTFAPAEQNAYCVWAPDGKHLVYSAISAGQNAIWWIRADGASQPQKLFSATDSPLLGPAAFSPDGRRLVFSRQSGNGAPEIWTLPLDLTDPGHPRPGTAEPFLREPMGQLDPAVSPDGRWIAYSSIEGVYQIFVRPFAGGASAGKWQISNTGGRFPVWSRSGHELFYTQNAVDGRLMVVDWQAQGESFVPGKPRQWGPTPIAAGLGRPSFDIAPDGKRFIGIPNPSTLGTGDDKGSVHVTVLLNFFDELRRRVP